MKNSLKLFAYIILLAAAIASSSCTKCTTCTHKSNGGIILLTWEVCGDKNKQDQAEADCNTAANLTPGSTCSCTTRLTF